MGAGRVAPDPAIVGGEPAARCLRRRRSESRSPARGLRGIIAMVPPDTIPDEAHITINVPVLAFTLARLRRGGAAFRTRARAASLRARHLTPLKEAGRGTSGGRRQKLLRGMLVVGEVALSLMLLVGASLMIRTCSPFRAAAWDSIPDRILTLRVPFSEQRYPDPERRSGALRSCCGASRGAGRAGGGYQWGLPPVYSRAFPGDPGRRYRRPIPGRCCTQTDRRRLSQSDGDFRWFGAASYRAGGPCGTHTAVVNQTFVRRYLAAATPWAAWSKFRADAGLRLN